MKVTNFRKFRTFFKARVGCGFVVPADTFDNVPGQFPIGFFVWHLDGHDTFHQMDVDVYDADGVSIGKKRVYSYESDSVISKWLSTFHDKKGDKIAYLRMLGTDMQHNKDIYISNALSANDIKECLFTPITPKNLIQACIYCTIRHVIPSTWLNDREQFLFPNQWKGDLYFQSDCLVYALFDNVIKSKDGTNHWIPFTAAEVGANDNFKSTFMNDFLSGKIELPSEDVDLFSAAKRKRTTKSKPVKLSREAKAVMTVGRELWRYYHKQPKANPNASFYDIRLHFQGMRVTASGKEMMNADSSDATYMKLLTKLRTAQKALAKAIEPKVYEYGFLKH